MDCWRCRHVPAFKDQMLSCYSCGDRICFACHIELCKEDKDYFKFQEINWKESELFYFCDESCLEDFMIEQVAVINIKSQYVSFVAFPQFVDLLIDPAQSLVGISSLLE